MALVYIKTKHFGCYAGFHWQHYRPRPRWDCLVFHIGFGELGEPNRWYKYRASVEVQLLPNFIWWQDVIRQDDRVCGGVQVHNRIVGIQSWPLLRFYGGRS